MINNRFRALIDSSVKHNRREILVTFAAGLLVAALWLGLSLVHFGAAFNGMVVGYLLAYRCGFRNGNLIGAIAATDNPNLRNMVEAMADQENRK